MDQTRRLLEGRMTTRRNQKKKERRKIKNKSINELKWMDDKIHEQYFIIYINISISKVERRIDLHQCIESKVYKI